MGRLIDFDSHPNNKNIKILHQNKIGSLFTVLPNVCNKVISQAQQYNPKNTPLVLCNQLVATNSWVGEGAEQVDFYSLINIHSTEVYTYILAAFKFTLLL